LPARPGTPADLALLALSAAVSAGLGIWRGQTIQVWRDADTTWWRQGSALTLALWGALIVARALLYGLDAVGPARPGPRPREARGLGPAGHPAQIARLLVSPVDWA
jgi:hypothetical protein